MIVSVQNIFPDDVFEHLYIQYVTRFWIDLTNHLHLQLIIMTVVIRIIAFTENRLILLFRPRRIVKSVRSVEVFFSDDCCSQNYFFV